MANPGERIINIHNIRIEYENGLARVLHRSGTANDAGEVTLQSTIDEIDVSAMPEYTAFAAALEAQLKALPDRSDPTARRAEHEARREARREARTAARAAARANPPHAR